MNCKKIVTVLLSAALIFSSANFAAVGEAFAAETQSEEVTVVESGKCGSKVKWTLDSEGTLTLSGTKSTYGFNYDKVNGTIYRETTDPATGETVLVPNPFACNDAIKKIVVEEGITALGNHLFYDCRALTEVQLPEGLTSVGAGTFQKCSSLESIQLPDSLSKIGNGAFKEATVLKSVELPEKITKINAETFNECVSLEEVKIPAGVVSIGGKAFRKCVSLKEINLPDGLTKLATHTLAYCRTLTEVEIPAGVTSIGDYCFYDCDGLTRLYLPEAVQFIDASCFEECDNLETVNIPKGVESIEKETFKGCSALKEIYLPQGITEIKTGAFYRCKSLGHISIPDTVNAIGENAFRECIALKELDLPEGLESIGKAAFRECRYLTKMDLPSKLKVLENFALFNCHQLKEVNLPAGLTKLGEYSLYGLSDMKEIVVPEGITEIGQFTFYGCKALEHAAFMGNISSIGESAFADCTQLRNINLPQELSVLGASAFENCSTLTGISLPAGVKRIDANTFRDCSSLKTVLLKDGITEIGRYAFDGCDQLKSLTVPATVTVFGSNGVPVGTKLYCVKGSAAETYAKARGSKYAYVGNDTAENLVKGRIHTADTQAEWTIDRDSEKMVITWNGAMPDYTVNTSPWKDDRAYIAAIEVFGNVKSLSAGAFSQCKYLKTLTVYNRNCVFSPGMDLPEDVTISGCSGSAAESYAKENGFAFVAIECEHAFNEGMETKDSTCDEQGEKTFTCNICQYEKVELLPLLDHKYEREIQPATDEDDGMFQVSCTACGHMKEFGTIAKADDITLSKTKCVYNGQVQKPQVVVRDGNGNLLSEYEDYNVQWPSGCKTTGHYMVKVILQGDYDGSKELYFNIVPKKTSSTKAVLYGYDDVKFSWSKVTGASGYLVYYKKGTGSWSKEVATTSTSYKKTNLSDGVKYTFKVVPYYKAKNSTTKHYDETQYKSTTIYTLKQVTGVKVAKSGSKVKVSWTNISGETGYQISKMTKKSATQKKPLTVKSSSAKYKKLTATKKKTYYYKVRAYKTVNGKNIYGPWSDVKSFKRK